jgi:PKD repeat protein
MVPRLDGDVDIDDAERARFTKKLNGYEAMGLDVDDLRQLLDEDLEEFRSTYLAAIRTQLEGGMEETTEEPPSLDDETPEEIEVESPSTETVVEEPPQETEEVEPPEETGEIEASEETDEVAAIEEKGEIESPEGTGVEDEGPTDEVEPSEEVAEEEADEETELLLEGAGPEEALAGTAIPDEEPEVEDTEEEASEGEEPEEAVMDDEVLISISDEEVPEEEEISPEEVQPPEDEEPEEEAEIEVEQPPEEVTEEEISEDAPIEEEALIVVAEVIDEKESSEEEEAGILIAGLTPEERTAEPITPDVPEPESVERPKPEPPRPRPRPVKKADAKKKATAPAPPKAETGKKTAPRKEAPKKRPPAKKGGPKKVPPPPTPRKRSIPMSMIAILVAVMLVAASAGLYFTVLKNEPPIALFTFDPNSPLVGETMTFDARNSHDPDGGTVDKYVWDFGDGTSGKGRVVKHSFIEAQDFTVRLTIEDKGGARETTQRTVTVEALEISMERPYISDLFQYDVVGNISLSNFVDGLFSFSGPTGSTEYIYAIVAGLEGDKTLDVIGTSTSKDGFMEVHDNARKEQTHYLLDIVSGTVETSMSVNPSFDGSMEAIVEEDICQQWERGVSSSVSVYADFSAVVASQDWATLSTVDEGTFYSQLTGITETFSLGEFLRETKFSSDDDQTHPLPIGGSTYLWKVKGMERVSGRQAPSLHVNITMEAATLAANDLDNFFIDVWLEPGLSQPSKYHVYVTGREEGNRYKVDLTETLETGTMGSDEAWGLPCSADHLFSVKSEFPEDFNQLGRFPEQGGTAGGFNFNPEDAYQEALSIPKFATYITEHPEAFFHLGNYTERGNQGTWVMAFGEFDDSEHNEVTVEGQDAASTDATNSDIYIDDELPLASPLSIGEVVTLSRGLRLMKAEPEIDDLCFNGNQVDWASYTFNITEGVSTISLDPTSVLVGSQETGYVYMLVSRSGPLVHRAALDATNGQVLFTWTHSQTWDTYEAFG